MEIAATLTRPFEQQRCDLYLEDGQLWFGEFSIYATSGLGGRLPEREEAIGLAWRLPADKLGRLGQERFAEFLVTPVKGTLG